MEHKRILKFSVDKQLLVKEGDFSGLVRGTRSYLCAEFSFPKEWNGCAKVAMWRDEFGSVQEATPILKVSGSWTCDIPETILELTPFYMSVIGHSQKGTKITTNEVEVKQL